MTSNPKNPFPLFRGKTDQVVRVINSIEVCDYSKKKLSIQVVRQTFSAETEELIGCIPASTLVYKSYIKKIKKKCFRKLDDDEHPDNLYNMAYSSGALEIMTRKEKERIAIEVSVQYDNGIWESYCLSPDETVDFFNTVE